MKVTGDAVKQLGLSIESKRLPWLPVLQSPAFPLRSNLRASRSNANGNNIVLPHLSSAYALTIKQMVIHPPFKTASDLKKCSLWPYSCNLTLVEYQ